jgi:hypothetical protein
MYRYLKKYMTSLPIRIPKGNTKELYPYKVNVRLVSEEEVRAQIAAEKKKKQH